MSISLRFLLERLQRPLWGSRGTTVVIEISLSPLDFLKNRKCAPGIGPALGIDLVALRSHDGDIL